MYAQYLQKMLDEFAMKGGSYVAPIASGMDGYALTLKGEKKWLGRQDIIAAEDAAATVNTAFICGDWYIGLGDEVTEQLRYRRFLRSIQERINSTTFFI